MLWNLLAGQVPGYEVDHHIDQRLTYFRQSLIILAQAVIAPQPSEGAFHDPPLQQDHEACGVGTRNETLHPAPNISIGAAYVWLTLGLLPCYAVALKGCAIRRG